MTADGSIEIREGYISTGATYWAMQAFGGLWSLPDDDPFWQVAEEPLPAETGDYVRVFPQPGWIMAATGGEVQRYNGGSLKPVGSKYAKFVYSTRHPFNVGLIGDSPAPGQMLSLSDGSVSGQRSHNFACAVGEPGWIRIRWTQELGAYTHLIDSVIVMRGECHIRAHRITLDAALDTPLSALEGGAALGYAEDELLSLSNGPNWQQAAVAGRSSAITALSGYDDAALWQAPPGINSVYPCSVVPVLKVNVVKPHHELLCLVQDEVEFMGAISAQWQADGTFQLSWADEIVIVPALPAS